MANYIVKKNNVVSLIRGDNFSKEIIIYDNDDFLGEKYILKNDDALYFGVMDPHQPFECALIRKKYTKDDLNENNNIDIKLVPDDTLDLIPGTYYYSIKLHKLKSTEPNKIDEVITVIPKTKFFILD